MRSQKSLSQIRAERFVTLAQMQGAHPDAIAALSATVHFAKGGHTAAFRFHVRGFCDQLRRERQQAAQTMTAHQARLSQLLEIDGHRLEKGKYGSRNKNAWRVWLPDGGHRLVYLNGRAHLTAEQALVEALAQ